MTDQNIFDGKARNGDVIVRAPRVGDAMGQTLKSIYATRGMPDDMQALLRKLDQVAIH